jgi:hypothetical protein
MVSERQVTPLAGRSSHDAMGVRSSFSATGVGSSFNITGAGASFNATRLRHHSTPSAWGIE